MVIPRKIIRIIQACVQKLKCQIKYGGGEWKEFHLETGLRQSDTLSSARFTIVLKTVINETLNEVTGIIVRNNQQMVVAAYAGGSTIMAEDE